MKKYKIIGFDLDGTLTRSRQNLEQDMAALLTKLTDKYTVAVMSGGGFPQYQKQFLTHLEPEINLKKLILLPTSGAALYTYQNDTWAPVYEYQFSEEDVEKVTTAITRALDTSGYNDISPIHGTQTQIRGTQISWSALGDEAPIEEKEVWDPNQKKRMEIIPHLKLLLPDFSVRLGGTTTIDITLKGKNKAFGIRELAKHTSTSEEDILYIGDALYEGGNDAAVLETNADTRKTDGPEETAKIISELLA